MLALWPFGDQYCTDIQSILLLSRPLIPFLLRWSVWRNMWRRFTLHCWQDKWAVWRRCRCRIFLFYTPLSPAAPPSRSPQKAALSCIPGLTPLQHWFQATDAARARHTCRHGCSLHTQTCRHTTDSNLACMITATLSCLGVLSHLALVFVAYPAACPAALVHRI